MLEKGEKQEMNSMIRFVLFWVVIVSIVLALLSGLGFIGSTYLQRTVFENSYQYSESRKSEAGIYQAQLAEIEIQLRNSNLSDSEVNGLRAQRSALNVRLNTLMVQ